MGVRLDWVNQVNGEIQVGLDEEDWDGSDEEDWGFRQLVLVAHPLLLVHAGVVLANRPVVAPG